MSDGYPESWVETQARLVQENAVDLPSSKMTRTPTDVRWHAPTERLLKREAPDWFDEGDEVEIAPSESASYSNDQPIAPASQLSITTSVEERYCRRRPRIPEEQTVPPNDNARAQAIMNMREAVVEDMADGKKRRLTHEEALAMRMERDPSNPYDEERMMNADYLGFRWFPSTDESLERIRHYLGAEPPGQACILCEFPHIEDLKISIDQNTLEEGQRIFWKQAPYVAFEKSSRETAKYYNLHVVPLIRDDIKEAQLEKNPQMTTDELKVFLPNDLHPRTVFEHYMSHTINAMATWVMQIWQVKRMMSQCYESECFFRDGMGGRTQQRLKAGGAELYIKLSKHLSELQKQNPSSFFLGSKTATVALSTSNIHNHPPSKPPSTKNAQFVE